MLKYSGTRTGVVILFAIAVAACADKPTPVEQPPGMSPRASSVDDQPDTSWIATPAGWYPAACVHEVPNGAHVDRDFRMKLPDGSVHQLTKCLKHGAQPKGESDPVTNGWVEHARAITGGDFHRLDALWTVPSSPTGSYTTGRVYYSFPGMQGTTGYIIQPVIQYGNNRGFGGSYWTAAPWHCNDGTDCVHGPVISTSAGHQVSGSVSASACYNGTCTWTITVVDQQNGQRSSYTIDDTEHYNYAVGGAVEAYNINDCSQYPAAGISYSNLALYNSSDQQVSPGWSGYVTSGLTPSCTFSVSTTATTAFLAHNPPQPPPTPNGLNVSNRSTNGANPQLVWGSSANSWGYYVYRLNQSTGVWDRVASTGSLTWTDSARTINTACPNTTTYEVTAYNGAGESGPASTGVCTN